MRLGVVFPGQGTQSVGMGVDAATNAPAAKALFDRAAGILDYDLLALQTHGPDEQLRETKFSQPAIFVTNVALFEAAEIPRESIVASAGHSFGELCSLTVAGALSFDEALRIVDERGKAMQYAAELAPGGMSAVLGLEVGKIREAVDRVVRETGLRVQLANFNSPSQIVISGDRSGVQAAGDIMVEAGAKRVVPLNVSGAWHSALMAPAVERFAAAVEAAHFETPAFDVISNVDAQPYRSIETIKTNLVRSFTDEVRWHETAEKLLTYDLNLVAEFGASPVLAPLMKRMEKAADVLSVGDMAGVKKLRARLEAVNA